MAQSAHTTQILQVQPSIFEIVAAESLDKTLYPALSRIIDFLGTLNPRGITFISPIIDEITLCANGLLQSIYFWGYGTSFGEKFYGLHRTSQNINKIAKLSEILSFLSIIALPYIEAKLRRMEILSPLQNQNIKYCLKTISAYKLVKAVQTFSYIMKLTKTHSPFLSLLNMSLTYSENPTKETKLGTILLNMVEILAFFLQFIELWYSGSHKKNIKSIPKPEVFKGPERKENKMSGTCPICLQKITLPTANSVSGYVYCWRCIATYLQTNKKCPVTNYPMDVGDLIRIYDE